MHKGAIVLVPFPFTDLSSEKIRPALVLAVQKKGDDCTLAFITSEKKEKVGEYGVCMESTRQNGLKVESFVRVDKLATLQKKLVIGEIGKVEKEVMGNVDVSLKKLFGLQ